MSLLRAVSGRWAAGLIGVIAAGATATLMPGAAASASDGNSWNPFASHTNSYTQPYDRAFIREWEANPPRG